MKNDNLFKIVGKTVLFVGNKLEILIPDRYAQHGCLELTNEVKTLGVFDMKVNGKDSGYLLPARITIIPSEMETITVGTDKFVRLTLYENDVFIKNRDVVMDEQLAYVVFYEIIYGGNAPKFLTYDDKVFLFDTVSEVTGISFPTDHVVFEMMVALLHRDKKDISLQYRLGDMKDEPMNIPLRLVSHAALSTTSKIVGSYMDDGIDAALVNSSDINSDIEDLLRQ